MANNKPTGAELRPQVQQAEALLESKKAELSRTLQAAEDAAIQSIVSGKKSLAPGLQTKARQLQEEVQVATESLQTLAKALALIEIQEAGQAAEAERNRVAHLMSQYRDCVGQLVKASNRAAMPWRRIESKWRKQHSPSWLCRSLRRAGRLCS